MINDYRKRRIRRTRGPRIKIRCLPGSGFFLRTIAFHSTHHYILTKESMYVFSSNLLR
jgi:hypothetical protein